MSGIFYGSGTFLGNYHNPYSTDQIYQGLGLTYEKVKCEFCDSVFVFSQNTTKCPNCGASYSDKCKFVYKTSVGCSG